MYLYYSNVQLVGEKIEWNSQYIWAKATYSLCGMSSSSGLQPGIVSKNVVTMKDETRKDIIASSGRNSDTVLSDTVGCDLNAMR